MFLYSYPTVVLEKEFVFSTSRGPQILVEKNASTEHGYTP